MARPLRIEYCGAVYHITSRGNEHRDIFFKDDDRQAFLNLLGDVCKRCNWLCHAYCLMSNHYHLLIETPEGNLSKGMRQLNGVYTQYINRHHRRVGHLFQGRYKSILVQKESYLLELARYIVLNPVRAGMVNSAQDWPWSSYRASVGLEASPDFLSTDWLLSSFAAKRRAASKKFARFVAKGKGKTSPWQELKGQIYLGSEQFVQEMQTQIRPDQPLGEVPLTQKRAVMQPLAYYAEQYEERDRAMAEAYRSGAYSLQTVGTHFGVSRMTVSRAVKKYDDLASKMDVQCEI